MFVGGRDVGERKRYDYIIRNALIYDGTGAAPFRGDLAVSGDRIASIGPSGTIPSDASIAAHDVKGLALAPGFIDTHTHDDRIVLDAPDMLPKISQGVTTVVTGNCGVSLAPVTFASDPPPPMNLLGSRDSYQFASFTAYAGAIAETVPATNVAALVGHSALRLATMPDVRAGADQTQIDAMLEHADEAMENGAAGFSTGLFYAPSSAADIDEVTQIAARFAAHGGVYATHMRDEGDRVIDSITEAVVTAKRAKASLVISHHKCHGPKNWGRTHETLPMIEDAARRQPVAIDAYPYAAGSTILRADLVSDEYRILITWSRPHPDASGRDLADIAADWNVDLAEAARRLDPAGAIYFQMDEADVRRVLAFPLTMIGSDGLPHDSHPHPRLWGTFPRVLGHYVREVGLFPLEAAVHKMTALPARTFRLEQRGRLAAGCFADLVVFNPDRIIDCATYEEPCRISQGIEMVFVNGCLTWQAGSESVRRAGRLVGGKAQGPQWPAR